MNLLAIDIGATKIAIALIDQTLQIQKRSSIPSQCEGDLWDSLKLALQDFCSEYGSDDEIAAIGIASAGPINTELGTISPVNIHQWRAFPLVDQIKKLFPQASISLIGDCTALALAEHTIGAGIGSMNMLGVVVSTGIGGGLILNGHVHVGQSGNAGLIGHHVIDATSDRICVCGRIGCLEEFARGPKMVEAAKAQGWNQGEDFQALAESARSGDERALMAIDQGARALAIGLVNAMMIADIHTVVIGGGVSFAGEIYWQPLRKHLAEQAAHAGFLEHLVALPAQLGADSGLLGAAIFARDY